MKVKIPIDYFRCSINKWTFKVKDIKKWVESQCVGVVLNLFSGMTLLNVNEIRNDINNECIADYHLSALAAIQMFKGLNVKFSTVILDPPYSYRKSMEFYDGKKNSRFKIVKDEIPNILNLRGRVITMGYHSNSMGKIRGFEIKRIGLFCHGGAIHDTIGVVEEYCNETEKEFSKI